MTLRHLHHGCLVFTVFLFACLFVYNHVLNLLQNLTHKIMLITLFSKLKGINENEC